MMPVQSLSPDALIATSLGRKLGSHHFWIVSDGTHRQTHAMRLHPLRIELTACSLRSSHSDYL